MTETEAAEAQREATATIRGYIYQFDASILAVLAAGADETVTVEGVEDFDIRSDATDTYGQVKYYEAQKLTDATLRDAILPMIEGFLRYPSETRERKHYVLYGHFKEAPETPPTCDPADLQRILVRRPYKVGDGTGKVRTEVNLQAELGASDADLLEFSKRFSIKLSEPFDVHRGRVVDALRTALGVSGPEAEGFCYPSALAAMAALSSAASKSERSTTRGAFLQKVRPKLAIYSAWALREEGENAYCKKIRDHHFARLNLESRDRFFVVTLPGADGLDDHHGLVQHIISAWSSHRIKRKPAKERYAPFFFFPDLGADVLTQLKTRLVNNGHRITDGYAFHGASFSVDHLVLAQTPDYPVSARFVADDGQFQAALGAAKRARLVIQLHAEDPRDIDPAVEQIAIPIRSASMARKIV
jgi:hypothetical protein